MSEIGDGLMDTAWAVVHPFKAAKLDKLRFHAKQQEEPGEPWMIGKSLREIDKTLQEKQAQNTSPIAPEPIPPQTPSPQTS